MLLPFEKHLECFLECLFVVIGVLLRVEVFQERISVSGLDLFRVFAFLFPDPAVE